MLKTLSSQHSTLNSPMNTVADVYNSDPEREWKRLEKDPYHTIEFLVTMHYIKKHFPPKGKILDAGGGPGRYSIELCKMGYDVVLLDISEGCIATAKRHFLSEPKSVQDKMSEFVVGDISDLSRFETNSFDAILCLGVFVVFLPFNTFFVAMV